MIREDAVPAEVALMKTAVAIEFSVDDVEEQPTTDHDKFVRVRGRLGPAPTGNDEDDDANDVEWGSFPFLFAISALAFASGRPAGTSVVDFRRDDEWSGADLLRCLTFVRAELHMDIDYVRGRRMKLHAVVRADGTFLVETMGRGDELVLWLDRLRGKSDEPPAGPGTLNLETPRQPGVATLVQPAGTCRVGVPGLTSARDTNALHRKSSGKLLKHGPSTVLAWPGTREMNPLGEQARPPRSAATHDAPR